jgi:UDP-N-acetylbacillosamine N-acetyltransferase
VNKSVVLIGAGGHARSLIALLHNNRKTIKAIYDDFWDATKNETILSVPVIGKIKDLNSKNEICLAIGDNLLREKLFNQFHLQILKSSIKHSTALIENSAVLGKSNFIFANVFFNALVTIGDNNIINTSAIIEHESVIGHHNHISVSAILCGRVTIGNNCFIGANAVIKDKIKICNDVIIGAGAVVVKDIIKPGVYVGNPAKKIK